MTRLTLKNGQWFDVKDKLKVRDKREVHTYAVDGVAADRQTYRFNVVKHQIATAAVRILNWSLTGDDGKAISWPAGKPVADRIQAVEGLDEDVFEELTDVLNAHLEQVDAASVAEKNAIADGASESGTTSPSAS
jgi:hypothetical protein